MRYAIGCRVPTSNKQLINTEGVLCQTEYGLIYGHSDFNKILSTDRVLIFENLVDVMEYIHNISQNNYTNYCKRAKKYGIPRDSFRFYPLKVDSWNFPIVLTKLDTVNIGQTDKHRLYYFTKKNMSA